MTKGRRTNISENSLKFNQKLVLNQWILSLFGVTSFEKLAEKMRSPELEGFDEDNVSKFFHCLKLHFPQTKLPHHVIFAYDQNIVRHWRRVTQMRRNAHHNLYPKYFQYLALLFTEIYLDRYFRSPDSLLKDLNEYVKDFNSNKSGADQIDPFQLPDLNKIAFWTATGSGKTLLMHVNILQYRHYMSLHGNRKQLSRIILLTPNEGLSYQHLQEFHHSGMQAELFSKESGRLFKSNSIIIIDIHKLREEAGEKTVAVEAFEGNNLVLVDEGHRGASSTEMGIWMQRRNQLCEAGFAFEYSATFGQAIKASGSKSLEQTYAKCIIFDYSYKYFYSDGYGKDYRIFNLDDDSNEVFRRRYLTACLLTFYEQLKLYIEQKSTFRPFLIERPLWTFVGGSVNAVRTHHKQKVSDVVDILLTFAKFVENDHESIDDIEMLLSGKSGLLTNDNRDLFANEFQYLKSLNMSPKVIFDDIISVVFNSKSRARLYIENIKSAEGEIALRLGKNAPFGVVNVGDAAALCKLCAEHSELTVTESALAESLFRNLNDEDSTVNILIGSKKFTEGWNSWRVSTMGLMNIGRNEGPQVIQLFGRGVRLKGKEFSLKRSRSADDPFVPNNIEILESLNIFGVRADYMKQFREYLRDEGLDDHTKFILPVVNNLGKKKLKIVRLKEGIDFKKDVPRFSLDIPPKELKYPVVLDWYPKLQAITSYSDNNTSSIASKDICYLDETHLAFLDIDAIYLELQRFKSERAWYNLCFSRDCIIMLLNRKDWYKLYIPKDQMEFRSFKHVLQWQEIAVALLKKYTDRFYKFTKQKYESSHLEYRELTKDDPNFINEYKVLDNQLSQKRSSVEQPQ